MSSENEKVNPLEESSITMLDVLEQEKEMEEEYAAVLGGSDEKCCTYNDGPIKRQALYSCLTCCPEAKNDLSKCAGICLACSYRCHENHELIELYTKRNFRCDCPTERFGNNRCVLNASITTPKAVNPGNQYNHNFQGLYCKCKRPYPDPDRTTEDEMLQCIICEDWFHLQHMQVLEGSSTLVEACSEMICDTCMEEHNFLQDYTGLALKPVIPDESASNISVTENGDASSVEENANLHSNLDKSNSNNIKMNGDHGKDEPGEKADVETKDLEPKAKKPKLEDKKEVESAVKPGGCKRPTKANFVKGATFWSDGLRSALCTCAECMIIYKKENVEFLLDTEDSVKSYEQRGITRAAGESSTYEQGIRALASIGRVQQIDAITEYNRMKDKLKEYLQTFAVNKQVVTEEDIKRFFEEMKKEKNSNVHQPYFCR